MSEVQNDPDTLELYREIDGQGRTLVLGHGFGGSSRNFRPQVRFLKSRYRVLLFDARGHARSPAPHQPQAYRLACFVRDLEQVIAQTDTERVVVGGVSMGAAIALHYAKLHPERVAGLVLGSYPSDSKARNWALGFADAIDKWGLDRAGSEFVWGERSRFDPKAAQLIRQGFLEHSPHAMAHILRELLAQLPSLSELSSELRQLKVPTLVVVGSNDAASLELSHELTSLIAGAAERVIPGAGHVVNLENAAAFNAALGEFLAGIPDFSEHRGEPP